MCAEGPGVQETKASCISHTLHSLSVAAALPCFFLCSQYGRTDGVTEYKLDEIRQVRMGNDAWELGTYLHTPYLHTPWVYLHTRSVTTHTDLLDNTL